MLLKHLKNHEVHPAVKYRAVLNPKNDGMNISDTLIKRLSVRYRINRKFQLIT
ncbi:hypothetical protein [Staphylococcus aureus]|uniref:hypothetical protein n=1 Tax=Staphylococcus aureus TaxID=1280 RepID=UPI0021614A17|nr:hypothetical protein [Staphylococcus aureus]